MYINKIVIYKNDAVGDLAHSLVAIKNIINSYPKHKIVIYLSERSINFSFLITGNNVTFKTTNYDLSIIDKYKIFKDLVISKVDKIFILSPKSFYYFLPLIFRKIEFYAICINGLNNYKRPSLFFRKFLTKYTINDRSARYKRDSSSYIQLKLTDIVTKDEEHRYFYENNNEFLSSYLKKNYAYFHIKQQIIAKLNWSDADLTLFFKHILKFHENIFITRDIENTIIKKTYNFSHNIIDLKKRNLINQNSNLFLFDNIEGKDLFNLINNSKRVISFHGMMTNLGSLNKKKVLDLFYCNIKDKSDYQNYRNSFYEFKPVYNDYDFIIPSKDINKTIRKMNYSFIK
jgi:hypothetical protein